MYIGNLGATLTKISDPNPQMLTVAPQVSEPLLAPKPPMQFGVSSIKTNPMLAAPIYEAERQRQAAEAALTPSLTLPDPSTVSTTPNTSGITQNASTQVVRTADEAPIILELTGEQDEATKDKSASTPAAQSSGAPWWVWAIGLFAISRML